MAGWFLPLLFTSPEPGPACMSLASGRHTGPASFPFISPRGIDMLNRPREDRFDEVHVGSHFTEDEVEFLMAIDRYQRRTNRRFLSWHEVLRVVRSLGYAKPAAASDGLARDSAN